MEHQHFVTKIQLIVVFVSLLPFTLPFEIVFVLIFFLVHLSLSDPISTSALLEMLTFYLF